MRRTEVQNFNKYKVLNATEMGFFSFKVMAYTYDHNMPIIKKYVCLRQLFTITVERTGNYITLATHYYLRYTKVAAKRRKIYLRCNIWGKRYCTLYFISTLIALYMHNVSPNLDHIQSKYFHISAIFGNLSEPADIVFVQT